MKNWWTRGLAALAMVTVAWIAWGLSVVAHVFTETDCADRPAAQVFQNVFDRPVPPGITGLLAAGRIWLGGRDVYLRFKGTDEAIRLLTRGGKRVPDAEVRECIEGTRMEERLQRDRRWVRWKETVYWGEVDRIAKPECYELLPKAPSTTPHISLILDRSRSLVYVYLFDI
jgi:hypothetical protein